MNVKAFQWFDADLDQRLLIEASAGTGKTFSLIHVVLRLIVEKRYPIERILMVTFTKAATAELRARIRELLIDILNVKRSGNVEKISDESLKVLFQSWLTQGLLNDGRVEKAIESMDDASIYTIHGFCQLMLQKGEFSGSQGFGYEIGNDDELKRYVSESFVRNHLQGLNREDREYLLGAVDYLPKIISKLYLKPEMTRLSWLPPKDRIEEGFSPALLSVLDSMATDLMAQLREVKLAQRNRSTDDLLGDMARELKNDAFVRQVRSLFDAVLIDEFQDTDPLQYEIFETLFLPMPGESSEGFPLPVIFVGDPKQSIYRFRNADLNTYLLAQNHLNNTQNLKRNFRSTPALMTAFNAFFAPKSLSEDSKGTFLHETIIHRDVEVGAKALPLMRQLENGRLMVEPVMELWVNGENPYYANVDEIREREAEFIASDIHRLLTNDVYLDYPKGKRLEANHIAVLVRSMKHADLIQTALNRLGIAYRTHSSDGNVFEEPEAMDILHVLRAMESPENPSLIKMARLTPIFGETLNVVASGMMAQPADDLEVARLAMMAKSAFTDALHVFNTRGISAVFAQLFTQYRTRERLVLETGGERKLVNYQHIIELLQEASRELSTLSGLTRWYAREIKNLEGEILDNRKLRVERDGNLVTFMTIHSSKGLEFPVVYLAGAYNNSDGNHSETVFRHTGLDGSTFFIAPTGLTNKGADEALKALDKGFTADSFELQERQEATRLGYVAMTRASRRLVMPLFVSVSKDKWNYRQCYSIYWRMLTGLEKPSQTTITAALEAFGAEFNGRIAKPSNGDKLGESLALLESLTGNAVCAEDLLRIQTNEDLESHTKPAPMAMGTQTALSSAQTKPIKADWVRTSFTAIQRLSDTVAAIEKTVFMEFDEPDEEEIASETNEVHADFLKLPGGKEFGVCLHALFEKVDFADGQLAQQGDSEALNRIQSLVRRYVYRYESVFKKFLEVDEAIELLTQMVIDVLTTAIALPDGRSLRLTELSKEKRWAEMDFTFSMRSPVNGRLPMTTQRLRNLLSHFDSLYHLPMLSDKELEGYLTGSIDLVFEYEGQYWVLDWKSNKRGIQKVGDYSKAWLCDEIVHARYFLQYLLYLVALKRHLRLKGRKETPTGAIYVFVRGTSSSNPHPEKGMWIDRPSQALIDCLDDAFAFGYDEGAVKSYAQKAREEIGYE